MAKTVECTINGTTWHMPASYRASRDVAAKVGDPLQMAIDAHKTGNINLGMEQVIDLIAIGVRHAGCGLDRDSIGEAIMDGGLVNYVQVAGEYIGAMVAGGPEKAIKSDAKKD